MLVPERRRRSDLVVAAIIVTVASLVLGLIWLGSDARGTTSVTAQTPLPPAQAASTVPASLSELWRAHSPATSTPVVAGGAVVAADGGSVAGFDPATGSRAWEYSRDRSLCDIVGAWDSAVAVYRDERGCAQVTELNGSTGAREKQRTSDADAAIELSEDGTYVTSRGDTRLEVWRSDLVRTLEYGRVDAPVNPDGQPRSGCTLLSSASNSSRLAVLESCPGDAAARLTTLHPAPEDPREPEEFGSTIVTALTGADGPIAGAAVLATVGDRVAVAIPEHDDAPAAVALFDGVCAPVMEFDLPEELTDGSEFDQSPAVIDAASVFSWWTGAGTVALALGDLSPRWMMPGALGPGALMAGRLLIPVPGGIAVVEAETGSIEQTIAFDRGDYSGPVSTAVIGDIVVEQRGDELVALTADR